MPVLRVNWKYESDGTDLSEFAQCQNIGIWDAIKCCQLGNNKKR